MATQVQFNLFPVNIDESFRDSQNLMHEEPEDFVNPVMAEVLQEGILFPLKVGPIGLF